MHHSDRGSQYLSLVYTERLAEVGIAPSVGSRGDSDNALAEAVNLNYYNYHRPRGGPDGQTPYERLRQKTQTRL